MVSKGVSRLVATFLRVLLLPVICIGIPLWPILGALCAVPLIGIFTIPLFLLTTLLLLYSVAWFSYLVLAQADPPASVQRGALANYLPFLPYSPLRCLKINWAAFLYASSTIRVVVPAILDWSYRRVMVLGTQGGGGIVKENILYGSPSPNKRLDVYLPPSPNAGYARGPRPQGVNATIRHRKHSTHFAEPAAAVEGNDDVNNGSRENGTSTPTSKAPVIIFLPSSIPPLTWTNKRKTYLQLALRLRRMGYCVIIPDITSFPEGRVYESIVDLRLVLRWVADNCHQYGGDERKIYLMGHGMSAHLAVLTLTQEAVVLSREGFLQKEPMHQSKRTSVRASAQFYPDPDQEAFLTSSLPINNAPNSVDESSWVDDPSEEDLAPGSVMTGNETLEGMNGHQADALHSLRVVDDESGTKERSKNNLVFPSQTKSARADPSTSSAKPATNKSISNGLKRVEIYEPTIDIPPVAGIILLAGVFDVIKCFRNESDRGIEHLSVLRRSCGPSHTACLLHSPAHLLYAAKNIIDTSLLPPKFLLIHGGNDAVIDISQSTLLKTLLAGIGVTGVKLRAYRELGHVEAIASLFLGMGKSSTRYSKQILNDIGDFIAS